MIKSTSSLEDDVLAAFERACDEQDLQIAEHLLNALDVFAQRSHNDDKVHRAYSKVASSIPKYH